jgi:hypothetical protein
VGTLHYPPSLPSCRGRVHKGRPEYSEITGFAVAVSRNRRRSRQPYRASSHPDILPAWGLPSVLCPASSFKATREFTR